jgi:hypothetical protein
MAELQTVPEDISFEEAIAFTQNLLTHLEQQAPDEAEVEQAIASLVQTQNGARGFFVTYLTGESAIADYPTAAIIQALRSAPEVVGELLTKNLAMSSAMAITHRRNGNETMAQGSDRVRSRTTQLIALLQSPELAEKLQQLQQSVTTGDGSYQAFLDRWGYDAEQRGAIGQVVAEAMG